MRFVVVALAAVLLASASSAEEKKKAPPKDDKSTIDDLFGPATPAKSSNLDAMKKATDGMGAKTSKDGLAAKVANIEGDSSVVLTQVFAAEHINQDKKMGCQPGGKDKKRVVEWDFDDVPARGKAFEVCLTM